eukprot:TRINITY_DN501_c0_g1_i4.p1 TRINITY_DN501_c0_g1~~TRINITY_DN501_c0_g1_i4.p1  ORF type:complete len:139 (+),score=15.40 TRINITY_DN501_c0_g1_i4:113-529(+)
MSKAAPAGKSKDGSLESVREFTDETRFDRSRLKEVSDGDTAFELELLEMWKSNIIEKIPLIRSKLELKDLDDAVLYSHEIKGACANVGAEGVREFCRQLEAFANQSKWDEGIKLLPDLKAEFEQTLRVMEKNYGVESF